MAEEQSGSLWDYHPLHVGANTIRIGGAPVTLTSNSAYDGKLFFRKTNAFLSMLLPVNNTTFFIPRVEWNTFTLNWARNPRFNQTHFYYFQFGLTLYTYALDKWRWIFRIDYNLDQEHFSQPGLYGLTTGLLWGAYQIHEEWHCHFGATAYKGMEGATLYPIIGLDYAPDKKWLFQLIFPILYSIEYKITPWCRLSLLGRPLRERFRTGAKEPQPRSVFNYSSMGTELNLHLEKAMRVEFELFGGYNFGGDFYIKNSSGHNALYTSVGGAFYGGAKFEYGF